LAVVDLETTGLSDDPEAEILEFGAVLIEPGARSITTVESLVRPQRPVPLTISHLTGLTDADVTAAPTIDEISKPIELILDGRTLIAHNADFERSFLTRFVSTALGEYRYLDTQDFLAISHPDSADLRLETFTRAMLQSEERHRGMFDHLPIGVYRCTPEGGFLDANPALVRILGYPDPGTLEKSYAATFYVDPADHEHFKSRLYQFGLVRGFETQLRCADGRQIRLRNTARIQRGPDGEVAYVEGTVEDVSNAWRAGGFYQDAARFQTIFEHGGIGILMVHPSGMIQDVNGALCRVSGYEKDELLGTEYAALWEADDQSKARASVEALIAGAAEPRDEVQTLKNKDGGSKQGRVFASLIRDWNDEPDHVLVLFEEASGS
ncbi:MAG: PAS domain S-box protein, partial [Gemmatimonadetes bacterium]|nr:PAS domain S-box protein [Gemmatimonadota bacterium]